MKYCVLFLIIALLALMPACGSQSSAASQTALLTSTVSPSGSPPVPTYTYRIVKVYPHDPAAFTQGLVYDRGVLYEGTGLEGQSSLRQVELETGKVLREYKLPGQYFGEGIALFGDNIYQLTYQSHIGFVYKKSDFTLLHDFTYNTEGWGLTQDGKRLIMSDGTSSLYFLDPQSLKAAGSLSVSDKGAPVAKINELEYIKGSLYANIWDTSRIAIINLADGRVTGWVDLSGLLQTRKYSGRVDVLNGIAYDSQGDRLFVTGKWWPYLFEIKLVPE
jgi:glutaminyl-peptide cyclotransferase